MIILHGTKDEVIPFEDSAKFADDNVIEFVPVQNADHRFTDPKTMDLAIHTIITFFEA
jgi:dipeptidyl aminopeptidase/acylaminoacyl peptidase